MPCSKYSNPTNACCCWCCGYDRRFSAWCTPQEEQSLWRRQCTIKGGVRNTHKKSWALRFAKSELKVSLISKYVPLVKHRDSIRVGYFAIAHTKRPTDEQLCNNSPESSQPASQHSYNNNSKHCDKPTTYSGSTMIAGAAGGGGAVTVVPAETVISSLSVVPGSRYLTQSGKGFV